MSNNINELLAELQPLEIGVVILCAGKDYGCNRNLESIRDTARLYGANEAVVCAAFGYLRDFYGNWCDCFTANGTPILHMDNRELVAAFTLACEALDCRDERGAYALPSMICKERSRRERIAGMVEKLHRRF